MEAKEPGGIGGTTGTTGGAVRLGPGEGWAVRMAGLRLLTRKVSGEQTGGAYSLFEVAVGPGGGEGPHIQHREDECFYVLEGRFGFVVEGDEIEAGPGMHLYVPKGALHAYTNNGAATGRLLAVHTPGGLYERFVEAWGLTAAGPAEFTALAAEHGMEICEKTEQIERSY